MPLIALAESHEVAGAWFEEAVSLREAGEYAEASEALAQAEALEFSAIRIVFERARLAALEVKAYPCEHDEAFRAFDFWVGDWEVHGTAGNFAGTNRIERAERGCVLIENWTSASGGTGMSINYLDKMTGEWVQVWNAEGGSQIHIRGGITEDGMLLVGTLHDVASDRTVPFRGLWTPLRDGRVRQYFEQSTDEGKTWTAWFEGFYTRTD